MLSELKYNLAFLNTTGSDQKLFGANPYRKKVIITPPQVEPTIVTVQNAKTAAVSTATTGVKLSYTVPAGKISQISDATAFGVTGTTQVLALQAIIGGVTVSLQGGAVPQIWHGSLNLAAGDTIQWNCTTAVAASTTDLMIGVLESTVAAALPRVTVTFGSTAVLDQGLNLYAGSHPLELTDEDMMRAVKEDIRIIGSTSGLVIGAYEFFGM